MVQGKAISDTANLSGVGGVRMLAREQLFCEFHGVSAHAGGNPWNGVNALDAFVASYNNISLLRQQIHDTDRIHAAILDAPKVANVIPAYTKVMFTTRSETLKGLKELTSRVVNYVKAGALASGCKVTIEMYACFLSYSTLPSLLTLTVYREPYYADIVLNSPLCDRYQFLGAEIGQNNLSSIPEVLTGSTDAGKSDRSSVKHYQLNKS
jgi:metal-dependent amidase/aminoacylase/carboxypeptidase family protein